MSTCIMIKLLQTEKNPRDYNELARETVPYYLEHQNEPWFFFFQNKKQQTNLRQPLQIIYQLKALEII